MSQRRPSSPSATTRPSPALSCLLVVGILALGLTGVFFVVVTLALVTENILSALMGAIIAAPLLYGAYWCSRRLAAGLPPKAPSTSVPHPPPAGPAQFPENRQPPTPTPPAPADPHVEPPSGRPRPSPTRESLASPPAGEPPTPRATPPRTESTRSAPPARTPTPARTRSRAVTPAPSRADTDADAMPFVDAGLRGPLFTYADTRGGSEHDGPYAILDVETTGLSPRGGDRVIEIAVLRMDARGRVEDEFATLIDPDGRDTGPVFIHGIKNEAVAQAPRFADVAPELLSRLDGAVVVAHNATFEEAFLRSEFARMGATGLHMPALCTLWLGRRTLAAPNYKLGTLAKEAGIPLYDKHAALGDVRALAGLLRIMLASHRAPLTYACPAYRCEPPRHPTPKLVTRAVGLRKGTDGWMSSIVARLPQSAGDVDDALAQSYVDALGDALADGKIIGDEAKVLARIAGRGGLGGDQVRALNERFLETMREAAFADDILTAAEIADLTRTAAVLGMDGYFDDLTPTSSAPPSAGPSPASPQHQDTTAPAERSTASPTPKKVRRCGHCRRPGHYRPTCPDL